MARNWVNETALGISTLTGVPCDLVTDGLPDGIQPYTILGTVTSSGRVANGFYIGVC